MTKILILTATVQTVGTNHSHTISTFMLLVLGIPVCVKCVTVELLLSVAVILWSRSVFRQYHYCSILWHGQMYAKVHSTVNFIFTVKCIQLVVDTLSLYVLNGPCGWYFS